MKLAIVITSLEVGGAEKMVLDLIREIKDKVEVKLFVIKKNYHSIYDRMAEDLNVDIYYLNNKLRFFNIFTAIKLKKLLDLYQPNIIHTHLKSSSYILYYYLFNKNIKWIHTVHTLVKIDTKIIRRIFFHKLYNNRKITLIAVSETVKETILNLYENANIKLINNGIDLHKFNNSKRINGNEVIITNVGRFVNVKNHEFLIKEFANIKNKNSSKLYLIGDGPLKKKMMELTNQLNISDRVVFVGYTNEVEKYLKNANIFVLSSLYEGMPLALLEAMATGLIAIAGEGGRDVIKDNENGFLINLQSGELTKKIDYVIENRNQLDYIKENAEKTAQIFSLENMANKYLNLYFEVAND